jgi:hypothetical protein
MSEGSEILSGGALALAAPVAADRRGPHESHPASHRATLADCLFLVVAVSASFMLWVWDLGFYSDDWTFLGALSLHPDQSVPGLFGALFVRENVQRPLEVLFLVLLYSLFGLQPLGYHLSRIVVFVAAVLLLYLVLRTLRTERVLALAIGMVFATLPHYSTDRVWASTFMVVASVAFFLASLYCDLRTLDAGVRARWVWRTAALGFLVLGALSYEIVLPLFLLNPLLVWHLRLQRSGTVGAWCAQSRTLLVPLLVQVAAVGLVALYKLRTTIRLEDDGSFAYQLFWIVHHMLNPWPQEHSYGLNIRQALSVAYGTYGVELPRVALEAQRTYGDLATLAAAVAFGIAVCWYLHRSSGELDGWIRRRWLPLQLVGLGILVHALGYAIFLTNWNVAFTPTGLANRTAIAAAGGVALVQIGVVVWVCARLRTSTLRRGLFCGLVGLLCASGFLINSAIASFWTRAYVEQLEILESIRTHVPPLAPNSTLLLDGVCSNVGPGIVFRTSWGFGGALDVLYGDYTLNGDLLSPRLQVFSDGVTTRLYEAEYHYSYDQLYVYHHGRKQVHRLTDEAATRHYMQTYHPAGESECPLPPEGHGEPIF